MEWNKIRKITIPEGEVTSITAANGSAKLVWQKPHIYGVSWDGSASATMSRTDDATSFATPTIGTGTTAGSSPFDNCYPWSEIKTTTIDNSVLVSIPKFWYKWTKSGEAMQLQICDRPFEGFSISPMHADRGDGKGERDVCYIGKYKCASDYRSKASVAPKTSITIGTARTGITSLGSGFYQQDYAAFWTIKMLFLVEWATWNGQSVLANTTNYPSASDIVTGGTKNMTYHTGVSAEGYHTQYRWIEDPWENLLEWVDGLYFNNTNVYCINNPAQFTTGSNGTLIGTRPTSTGYIKSWYIPTVSNFGWALLPANISEEEAYTYDEYYYVSTGTVPYIGGARNSWAVHGPWFMYTDFTETSTSSLISSRLMYLP